LLRHSFLLFLNILHIFSHCHSFWHAIMPSFAIVWDIILHFCPQYWGHWRYTMSLSEKRLWETLVLLLLLSFLLFCCHVGFLRSSVILSELSLLQSFSLLSLLLLSTAGSRWQSISQYNFLQYYGRHFLPFLFSPRLAFIIFLLFIRLRLTHTCHSSALISSPLFAISFIFIFHMPIFIVFIARVRLCPSAIFRPSALLCPPVHIHYLLHYCPYRAHSPYYLPSSLLYVFERRHLRLSSVPLFIADSPAISSYWLASFLSLSSRHCYCHCLLHQFVAYMSSLLHYSVSYYCLRLFRILSFDIHYYIYNASSFILLHFFVISLRHHSFHSD